MDIKKIPNYFRDHKHAIKEVQSRTVQSDRAVRVIISTYLRLMKSALYNGVKFRIKGVGMIEPSVKLRIKKIRKLAAYTSRPWRW